MVSPVTRCREKSSVIDSNSAVSAALRAESASRSRRCVACTTPTCCCSAFHAAVCEMRAAIGAARLFNAVGE